MGGPIYEAIVEVAGAVEYVRRYFAGDLDRNEFRRRVTDGADELIELGLTAWQVDLLRRMPRDDRSAVSQLSDFLASAGLPVPAVEPSASYTGFRDRIRDEFLHLPDRFTSIFPEEGRIAYELSTALRPRRIVVAGSYYAFLAIWLTPGLASGGSMVCLDPDSTVCDLARENVSRLGYDARISIRCGDAIEYLRAADDPIDLLVIDAYGSTLSPDPGLHGKAIYGPIAQAGLPLMSKGGFILAHNADRDSPSLDTFFGIVSTARDRVFLDTTEHLAAFRL